MPAALATADAARAANAATSAWLPSLNGPDEDYGVRLNRMLNM
jgi:hypothetical protein